MINYFDSNVAKNISTFMFSRLLLFLAITAITVFLRQEVLGVDIVINIYSILALTFLLSLASVVFWEDVLRMRYFVPSQMLYDILLTSLLIFYTGISESIFLFLYIINIILAAVIYQLHGALFLAGLAGSIYGVLFYINKDIQQDALLYSLLYNELFFLITALLCGQLMDEMVKQRRLLATQQADLDNLRDMKHALLNNMPASVILVDADNNITEANQTAVGEFAIGDWSRDWINFIDLIPELDRIRVKWKILTEREKLMYRFVHNDQTYSLQLVFFDEKDNSNVPVAPDMFPEEEPDMMLVIQNISKLSIIEGRLRDESKLAAIGQFAAGLAHEIRNPLASISGAIETLSRRLTNLVEDDRKLLQISVTESGRVNRLITDFLQFARPSPVEFREFGLRALLDDVCLAIESRQGDGASANIQINVDEDLHIFGDNEKIKQVFFNLILNSIQASSHRAEVKITIVAVIENDMIRIDYFDDGEGIPFDKRQRIFEPFYTTKDAGTGLGLSTVMQIVSSHQGTIELVDTKVGVNFRISLPLEVNDKMAVNS